MRTVYVFHNTLMFYNICHFANCALQIAANLRIICELQGFHPLFLCVRQRTFPRFNYFSSLFPQNKQENLFYNTD